MSVTALVALPLVTAAPRYPWPAVLVPLLVLLWATNDTTAAIGGPRGSSVESTATGAFHIVAVMLLTPMVLPLLVIGELVERDRPALWRLWNASSHLFAIAAAAVTYWAINPSGSVTLEPAFVMAVTLAVAIYYLLEAASYTWVQTRLHHYTVRESGLWAREGVVIDLALLAAGASAGTLLLISPWLAGPALVPVALALLLLKALDRAHDGVYDAKTSLLQLPAFTHWSQRALTAAQRQGQPVSLVMVDLDHFRALNTRKGHQTGDRVLVAVADLLRAQLRSSDLAGRYGGDEFIVLLSDTDEGSALHTAERIRAAIAQMGISSPRGDVAVTASFGVATHQPGLSLDELIAHADDALYAAKNAGRDRSRVWGED
jgi:diguanylate cyclase (GGDEF)-like protein